MKALKKKSKLSLVLLALILALGLFAGCSSDSSDDGDAESLEIIVGASPTPHAEILNEVIADLEAEGYTLKVTEFEDYILPNTALDEGELTANFFQHKPYLESFNEENGTDLVPVAAIHFEPIALYAGKTESLDALAAGAKIAVPNDGTNEGRALHLLEDNGLIKLKSGSDFNITVLDIEESNGYEIVELEAPAIPTALGDVDVAVINGNYAIEAGLKIADALASEEVTSSAAETYANYIVVKAGDEDNAAVKALVKAIQTDKIKKFIEEKYQGAVVAVF